MKLILFFFVFFFSIHSEKSNVLVELFTSQGCSSCPSADKLMQNFSKQNHILVLSFHVDYWNYIGHIDPHSKNIFSERQRAYPLNQFSKSIYTPQAIVNGKYDILGSDEKSLINSIQKEESDSKQIKINLYLKSNFLKYSFSRELDSKFMIAIVKNFAKNKVSNGENSGRELSHVNIVQELIEVKENSNSGSLDLNPYIKKNFSDYSVICFLQKKDGTVLGAEKISF